MSSRLGVENLQWQVFQLIFNRLNAALAEEQDRGFLIDDAFNELTGRGLVHTRLDPIAKGNFHMGHRPSLIEAPVSEWPAVAVMAYSSVPSPVNGALDQSDSNRITLSIECIVHAGPYTVGGDGRLATSGGAGKGTASFTRHDGEEAVDRKIKRTAEAIHVVMVEGRFTPSPFFPSETPPTITFGEVFIRDGATDGTDQLGRYFWQGVRFQYTYDKTTGFSVDQN